MILNLTVALLVGMAPVQAAKKPSVKPAKVVAMPSNVVARYNGVDITIGALKAQLNATMARKVVPDLIQQIVIEKLAKTAGVTVAPAELAAKVKEEKAKIVGQMAQNGAMMEFSQITREFGLTEAEVTQTVRLNLLARKAFEKSIAKDVRGLDGQLKLAHILLATVPLAPSAEAQQPLTPELQKKREEDQKVRIDQMLVDINAGKLKFEDAAKQFSDDKGSGAQGGDLPWASKGTFVPEFETAAFALQKPGDISAPIKSQFGWHIIKLVQKGVNASPPEKAKFKKEQIDLRVNQPNAVQQWLGGMARGAKITFNTNTKLFK